jgi:hypothetical protein
MERNPSAAWMVGLGMVLIAFLAGALLFMNRRRITRVVAARRGRTLAEAEGELVSLAEG